MNLPFPGYFVLLMQCDVRTVNAPALWHFMRTIVNPDGSSNWLLRVKYACGMREHRMPEEAERRVETVQAG